MASHANDEKPGFSAPGFSWTEYIKYRPLYPQSFYQRIYDYHTQNSNTWETAHDVGAGAGIASQELATKFQTVIVSDPNDGYANIAAERLIKEFRFPEKKFKFLQEGAEKASVEDASVDLLVICQAIHWTDIPRAMEEFARQLKKGGMVAISAYGSPRIPGNPAAQAAWDKIFEIKTERLVKSGGVLERAIRQGSSGLDTVPFPIKDWEKGAKRIVANSGVPLSLNVRSGGKAESRVGVDDVREFVETDEDWIYEKDVGWLKGMFASFLPSIQEHEIQDLWTELENAVGGPEKQVK
jgi:ubiquinone/menaquinone biosynthesis C-methylase UbiE